MPVHIIKDIKGQQTELLMQQFADRMLILVTQMGKMGTLVSEHSQYAQMSLIFALDSSHNTTDYTILTSIVKGCRRGGGSTRAPRFDCSHPLNGHIPNRRP
jgi:hypothetical protein